MDSVWHSVAEAFRRFRIDILAMANGTGNGKVVSSSEDMPEQIFEILCTLMVDVARAAAIRR